MWKWRQVGVLLARRNHRDDLGLDSRVLTHVARGRAHRTGEVEVRSRCRCGEAAMRCGISGTPLVTVVGVAQLMTVDQAADRLGTSPRFIRRLITERRIAFTRIGRHIRFEHRDLEAYVAAGRVEPRGR